ncbi:MAG: DUF971 domain-containing protein [Gammaproteobacteria bacterium AqS3]|nr:DUF971 domain-containing protein [Gammaproteobacteria bacterium AqS3]
MRRCDADAELQITLADGSVHRLSYEFLRVHSPSAEVQGHGGGDRGELPVGKSGVGISEMRRIGRYAVQLVFSDGHDTGIYSWAYLHELLDNREDLWAGYLARLETAGASRTPSEIFRG